MIEKIKNILKRPLYITLMVLVVLVGWGVYSYFTGTNKPSFELTTVKKGDISQEVSVTGRVQPAQSVDLAFERGGKVARLNAAIGDKVVAGQILAVLNNADLAAQVDQAEASSAKEQITLDEMKKGTRPEELRIAATAVANAQIDLRNVENKAETDLNNYYDDVKDILNDAYIKADDAVNKQTDELFNNDNSLDPKLSFYSSGQATSDAEWKRRVAGGEITQFKQELDALVSSQAALDLALLEGEGHLDKISDFLNSAGIAVNESSGLSATNLANYKAYVNVGRANVNTALKSISAQIQSIAAQKNTNQSNISTAQNSLAAAQDELKLQQAGSTPEEILAQQAQVQYAKANVDNARAALSKTFIFSPISGVITRQDVKVGEIMAQNTTIISVMSLTRFEIEANIPEADIAKVKIGDSAAITLDAYGNDVVFDAKVIRIDPAEIIIDGVATYKTTFQFLREDERVKSGMTANIDILTAKKSGVLVIPQRAITQQGNEQFVQISLGQNKFETRKVVVGLRGFDGNAEIISGLNENDQIVSIGQAAK